MQFCSEKWISLPCTLCLFNVLSFVCMAEDEEREREREGAGNERGREREGAWTSRVWNIKCDASLSSDWQEVIDKCVYWLFL